MWLVLHFPGCFGPFKWQMDDFARCLNFFQRLQGSFEHRGLTGAVAGLTKRPSKWILDGGDAWHAHRGGQVRDGGQADGGKASGLEFALYQSNGPAANRSGGDKHNDIRHILFQVVN